LFVFLVTPNGLFAQSLPVGPDVLRPASDVGGYTGRAMNQIYRQSVGRGYSAGSLNRIALQSSRTGFGNAIDSSLRPVQSSITSSTQTSLPSAKPFASASTGPTVSPYLNLFNDSFDDATNSQYISFVRPQLEQQRMNRSLQLQQQALDRRVQEIAAAPAYSPQGSEAFMPTGHPSVFLNTGRYYPGNFRRRR
jgi:hypothetical protein